jgi:hypothetical protein
VFFVRGPPERPSELSGGWLSGGARRVHERITTRRRRPLYTSTIVYERSTPRATPCGCATAKRQGMRIAFGDEASRRVGVCPGDSSYEGGRVRRTGRPDVLELRDVPDPAVGTGTKCASRSRRSDQPSRPLGARRATGLEPRDADILGCESSALRRRSAASLRHVKAGDKVLVGRRSRTARAKRSLAGDDNLCRHYD